MLRIGLVRLLVLAMAVIGSGLAVTLGSGQTLPPGSGWTFAGQASGTGTFHPTAGDTLSVTYTTGGATFTQSGHYPEVDPLP
jgi:hypothetical protein